MMGHWRKKSCYALLLLLFLSANVLPSGLQNRSASTRVRFPAGRTTVVLKGVIRGTNDRTYVLRAERGQTLIAHLAVKQGEYAGLLIEGPGGIRLTNEQGNDAADDFNVALPRTGDYRIVVFPPDTNDRTDMAHYTLELTIR